MALETLADRKKVRWFCCDICGHTWSSYGKGKRIICPKCYESRTGKKLGRSPEEMEAMRAAKGKAPEDPQTNIYDFIPPAGEAAASLRDAQEEIAKAKAPERVDLTPQPEGESFLSRLLNTKIL